MLKEFGLVLDDSVEVRVWDSSAQIRVVCSSRKATRDKEDERSTTGDSGYARIDDRRDQGESASFDLKAGGAVTMYTTFEQFGARNMLGKKRRSSAR